MKSHKKDIFIRNQATGLVLKVSKILRIFSSKSFLSSLLLEGDVKIIKRDNDPQTWYLSYRSIFHYENYIMKNCFIY